MNNPLFLDASAILRFIGRETGHISDLEVYGEKITDELVEVECLRTFDRMRLTGTIDESALKNRRTALTQLLNASVVLAVDKDIFRRASMAMPVVLRTLDAIHLTEALGWREERGGNITIATHDLALARAAKAYGMEVIGA